MSSYGTRARIVRSRADRERWATARLREDMSSAPVQRTGVLLSLSSVTGVGVVHTVGLCACRCWRDVETNTAPPKPSPCGRVLLGFRSV